MGAGTGMSRTAPAPASQKDAVQVWLSYAPGERIAGKYQLLRTLDQGGMGVVWVAHHLGLDVHVALKLVRPEVESPEAAERLVVEAQAAARIKHPAIVGVLDVGRTDEGDPFLVMELLEGESLREVLDRERRLDVVTALRLILPVTGALEAMHAKGVIHRDIKPDNIFLARDDAGRWQPKLIDFGLARIDERLRGGRITQRGMIVGTPVYLSAERLRGEEADPRDDVWAACVVLYQMVTGSLPFDGDNCLDLFVAIAAGEPQSLAFHGVDDEGLWEILRQGLRPRASRYKSMRELESALTRALLKRGATRDITGVALTVGAQGTAAPPSPKPRAAAHDMPTTRIARPAAAELPTVRVGRPAPPPAPAEAAPEPAPPEAPRPSDPPADAPPAGARLTPLIALALVSLGIVLGLIAGVLIGRSQAAPPPHPLSLHSG